MQDKGFIFDYSKCVGCHACIAACYVENKTKPPMAWRQVNAYNQKKIPLAGYIYLSLACNHCEDAPCLKSCPASAYQQDGNTGAVIHVSEKCIGCKYCTWACPFNAPKYNKQTGLIEKCSFCNHRLIDGMQPACTNLCPTGALSFGSITIPDESVSPGIINKSIRPKINTLQPFVINQNPIIDNSLYGDIKSKIKDYTASIGETIRAKHEWPLVLFTFICAFIVGWFTSFNSDESTISKTIFSFLGITGLVISTLHLGKPLRSYRSIANLSSSWVSREILAFGVFGLLSLCYLFIIPSLSLKIVTIISGVLLLLSIEMVYSLPLKLYSTPIHSANTIITGLLFATLFNNYLKLTFVLLALKGILFIVRVVNDKEIVTTRLIFYATRLLFGVFFPLGIIGFIENPRFVFLSLLIIAGELIDRYDYYDCLYVNNPGNLLIEQLNETI